MNKIGVYVYPDDPQSDEALRLVAKHLETNQYEVILLPPGLRKAGRVVPFISNEDFSKFQGLAGIRYFLEHRHEAHYQPVLNPPV